MSRWSLSRYTALVSPRAVVVGRAGGTWSSRLEVLHGVEVPASREIEQPWEPPVAALAETLKAAAIRSGQLAVVLSNHFVRYLLIPWNEQIGSIEEQQAYVHASFERVFGAAANGWSVTCAPERAGAPRLAAAVDKGLMDAVQSAVASSHLTLASIQPYLMYAFNRFRKLLPRRDFLLATGEPGRLCLVAAADGSWRAVRNSGSADDAEALAAVLEREWRLLEAQVESRPHIVVWSPHISALTLPHIEGVVPQILGPRGAHPPGMPAEAALIASA